MLLTINKLLLQVAILFSLLFSASISSAESSRDILLGVANKCLDPKVENYCTSCLIPRTDSACSDQGQCKLSLDVWSLSDEFVSFRDAKMCGCSSDFIHGLTIPRKPITGVEDPLRPDNIWSIAWRVGLQKIPESELALVVNPKSKRSQDQLHVHMVRFFHERLPEMKQYYAGEVRDLNYVWHVAGEFAEQNKLSDYGVLVIKSTPTAYSVFVTSFNSEHAFTNYKCN